jgi:filamentous hemagglutinin family protein
VSKALSSWFGLSLCTLGYLYATSNKVLAQVTSDGTVNTQVTENGNTAEITGGETRGDNLFHSFQDFSVPTGNEASFLNANDISNIFSRVTGGNISNIDGLISANGSANLFLINPSGIIFGEGARLDIGGSFYGSSASSILFEDGEFSATDLNNPPVLTINAPIGLNLRDQPADIVNRSVVQDSAGEVVGLEVLPGNNLAFVGGNISFEAGAATARGANIQLGGLTEAGIVSINPDGSLSFPDDVTKADINLSNGAYVDVSGTGEGSVSVKARNLNLNGSSFIRAGISFESTNPEAQAGDITIDVAENITLDGGAISNINFDEESSSVGLGNSGNITINTGSLEAFNGGSIDASTFGQGDAGEVQVTATENITIDGISSSGFPTGITSFVATDAEGNAGGVTISTTNLNLTNGGSIDASTFGQGDAGVVNVTASGDITADGESSEGFASGITSAVNPDAVGDAGGVTITTTNLNLTNGGRVDASTFGQGDAGVVNVTATGDITADGESSEGFASGITSAVNPDAAGNAGGVNVTTTNLNLTNGGSVDASTFGQGNAGEVQVTATGDITIDGESLSGFPTGVTSFVNPGAVGNAGGVNVTTTNLNLTNGGSITASTFGQGDAGEVQVTADGDITVDGENSEGFASGITSAVNPDAVGNADGVTISTNNLTLTNGGQVSASTFGWGNSGSINIYANTINISGLSSEEDSSGLFANSEPDTRGNAGSINVYTSDDFRIANNGTVTVSSEGLGDGGDISINANNLTLDNSASISATTLSGRGSNAELSVREILQLDNNSKITAGAFQDASGGNVLIDARFIIAFPSEVSDDGNDIIAEAEQGSGGNINIYTEKVFGMTIQPASPGNGTNDISTARQQERLDLTPNIGTVIPNVAPIISSEQITEQACQGNRATEAQNGLVVKGKGGVSTPPDQPLTSQNLIINGEVTSAYAIPEPIETSKGKIQLARGIRVTKDGRVILTPYPTNNAGERIPEIKPNCS